MTTTALRGFLLNRVYPLALRGLPGLGTPQALAAEVRAGDGTLDDHIDRLVRRHLAITSATGFLGGLGGWLTLPVTLPANIAGVALVQMHMGAAIASLCGYDPTVPAVREAVLGCLIGVVPAAPARDADQEAADRVGLKLAERGLRLVASAAGGALRWGGRRVAQRTIQRRLLRGVPLVGGVIGAVSDGWVTLQVARCAREAFSGGMPARRRDADFPPSAGDGLPDGVGAPTPAAPREA